MEASHARERRFDATLESLPRALAWVQENAPRWADSLALDLGVSEALTNAIAHGVHGLDRLPGVDREQDLGAYLARLHRELDPELSADALSLAMDVHERELRLTVRWRGLACPEPLREPPAAPVDEDAEAPLRSSGRGMMIIHGLFDQVRWLEDGLGLQMVLTRPGSEPTPRPG